MTTEISPQSWLVTLEFHDDTVSREAVLINVAHIPGCDLPLGSLARVAPYHPTKSTKEANTGTRHASDTQAGQDARSNTGNTTQSYGADSEVSKRTAASAGLAVKRANRVVSRTLEGDSTGTIDRARSLVFRIKDLPPDLAAKRNTLQISLHASVRTAFHLTNRQQAVVYAASPGASKAEFVELSFRDQYLSRSDMWQLAVAELSNRSVFRGQQLLFLGSIQARVKNIFVHGRKVNSALATQSTVPIFRSESAKYVFFIQMSREMWEYDAEGSGEIMFSKVINGFLPDLFKRWQKAGVKHIVSIILFARIEYDKGILKHSDEAPRDHQNTETKSSKEYRDYYRAVTTDAASIDWVKILSSLKQEFKVFLRDTLILPGDEAYGRLPDTLAEVRDAPEVDCVIAGRPTIAAKGNILECINLGSSQFAQDYFDRDFVRTGISLVIITAGTGVFEVDYRLLKLTTDTLVGNGIGIDLVALAPMPLHSVPLFRYQDPDTVNNLGMAFAPGSLERGGSTPRNLAYHQMPAGSPDKTRNTNWGQKPTDATDDAEVQEPQWSFAMPHWIDVSFWTGEVSNSSWEDRSVVRSRHMHRSAGEFTSSCRMYELQMMGLMEIEMSDICIPVLKPMVDLPTDSAFLSKTLSNESPKGTSSFLGDSAQITPAASPNKRASNENPQLANKRSAIRSWMSHYEDQAFEEEVNTSMRRSIAATNALNKQRRSSAMQRKTLNSTESPLSTSVSVTSRSPKASAHRIVSGRAREDSIASTFDTASIQSTNASPRVPRLKSSDTPKRPKAPRQFSMGLRGLGPGKAVASTSLSSAGAEFTSAGTTEIAVTTQPLKPSVLLAQQLRNTLRKKPSQQTLSDVDSLRNEAGGNAPLHSDPISIRKEALEENTSDDENLAETVKPGGGLLRAPAYSSTFRPSSSHIPEEKKSAPRPPSSTGRSTANTSPWLTLLNPSNPRKDNMSLANQFRRWQHVFPRAISTSAIKWKSLTSPAALPLTSEHFPTFEELQDDFEETIYSVRVPTSDDAGIRPTNVRALMRLLIAARLSSGFQIVIGNDAEAYAGQIGMKLLNCFQPDLTDADTHHVALMSVGNDYHQLQVIEDDEVTVKRFRNKAFGNLDDEPDIALEYRPRIRTMLAETYQKRRFVLRNPRAKHDWSLIDAHCAGGQGELLTDLRYWRARFVLIPVDVPKSGRTVMEVSDEETRLEGIQKLTQMWQRFRYIPPGEKRFHASLQQRNKDTNPLAIDYQTRDPSAVVKTYASGAMDSLMIGWGQKSLFTEAELYHSNDFDMQRVALHFQSKPPRGIPVADRRWHWKVYESCFRGDEFVTWLLETFKDVETREDGVKLGNELMKKGLFKHVQSKHMFRDGNYFYSVLEEYRTVPNLDSKTGWFGSKGADKPMPGTPAYESHRSSPLARRPDSRQSKDSSSSASSSGHATPIKPRTVELSRLLQYDVDPRGKSWRPEIIHLHYDRIHNPDNCYHLRIDWMNVTSKLIEDCIVTWAMTVERYGLKLVELPINESSQISNQHPFRAPYKIKLAYQPPRQTRRSSLDPTMAHAPLSDDQFPHHKALLCKWDFVLDTEAARSFDCGLPVAYSWGKPEYKHTQFIHKIGTLMVEIDDNGDFLMLANRLYNNRSTTIKEQPKFDQPDRNPMDRRLQRTGVTPAASPMLRPTEPPSPHLNPSAGVAKPVPTRHPSSRLTQMLPPAPRQPSLCETRLAGLPANTMNVLNAFERFCHSKTELEAFFETTRLGGSNTSSPRASPRFFPASVSARLEEIPTLGLGERRLGL